MRMNQYVHIPYLINKEHDYYKMNWTLKMLKMPTFLEPIVKIKKKICIYMMYLCIRMKERLQNGLRIKMNIIRTVEHSVYHVIVRPNKIIRYLCKAST